MSLRRALYALSALTVYLLLVLPLMGLPFNMGLAPILESLLYLIIAIAVSLQVTDDLLSLIWRPVDDVKQSEEPVARERVAVLMTTCNDCSEWHIAKLQEFVESGYQVYILDDSNLPSMPNAATEFSADPCVVCACGSSSGVSCRAGFSSER